MDACILSSCVHTPILCFLQIAPPLKNLSVIVTVQGKRLRRCTLLNARIIDDLEDTNAASYSLCGGCSLLRLCLLLLRLPIVPVHAASIRYAAPTAQGSGDCSSWSNACTLQTALTTAVSGDQI
jgi:hypothetical protein